MAGLSDTSLVGTVVAGRYEVTAPLAHGGMGTLYRVVHKKLGRPFAMKTLLPQFCTDREFLARFRREADIVARLNHPNIVAIVDWEELANGSPCIVMELLRGEDLGARLCREGPLPWPALATIADETLSALCVAHSAGVVHRDLKPENIFLAVDDAGDEHVKLLDFGVSKIRWGRTVLTSGGGLLGTPAYMSPEQAEGRDDQVDASTDVWAMGAILYEMATGRQPFLAPDIPATLFRICYQPAPKMLDRRADAPPAFVDLIERALTRAPPRRIATTHQLRKGLRGALAGVSGVVFAEPLRSFSSGEIPVLAGDELAPTVQRSDPALPPAPAIPAAPRASWQRSLRSWRRPALMAGAAPVAAGAALFALAERARPGEAEAVSPRQPPAPAVVAREPAPAQPPAPEPPPTVRLTADTEPVPASVARELDGKHLGKTPLKTDRHPAKSKRRKGDLLPPSFKKP